MFFILLSSSELLFFHHGMFALRCGEFATQLFHLFFWCVCVCVATWQIPVKNEETKTVCCLCCQSGPITAIAWLPKSGYVPGETILFCGRVDNKSRSRLLHTSVRLVEVYTPFPPRQTHPTPAYTSIFVGKKPIYPN